MIKFQNIVSLFVATCLFLGTTGPTLSVHYCHSSEVLTFKFSLIKASIEEDDPCTSQNICEAKSQVKLCCKKDEDAEPKNLKCCTQDDYSYSLEDDFVGTQTLSIPSQKLEAIATSISHYTFKKISTFEGRIFLEIPPPPLFTHCGLFELNMIWII